MNRITRAGLLATCSAALVLGAPMAANAASTSAPAATMTASRPAPATPATLTFVGGTLDGSDLRVQGYDYVDGTSRGPGSFTQDDGWDPKSQQWTGGNELTVANDYTTFSIGDLVIKDSTVTGHPMGADDLPWWLRDLTAINATATHDGDRVTITAKDADDLILEMRFALKR
ncbi:MAG: hypothetical protein U0R64_02280 [Candidatus Nanopelagicales bacterium]